MPQLTRRSRQAARRQHVPRAFVRRRALSIEGLEARHLLAGNPVITEFLASNRDAFADGDGNFSDFIEIQNLGDAPLSLAGWHLTDDRNDLRRWTFPQVPAAELEPGEFLVVFASGQTTEDYLDAGGSLHTNFQLDADGEYLALVRNDGRTVVSEFGANGQDYPPQAEDISYGIADLGVTSQLIRQGDATRVLVPAITDAMLGTGWTGTAFDDQGWTRGTTPIGYETGATELYEGVPETPLGFLRPAAQNLLKNPSFETNTGAGSGPSYWTTITSSFGAWSGIRAHDGSWVLHAGANFQAGGRYQDVATSVGTTYELRFWATGFLSGAATQRGVVQVGTPGTNDFDLARNNRAEYVNEQFSVPLYSTPDSWVEFVHSFTALSETTRISFQNISAGAGQNAVNIDQVSLLANTVAPGTTDIQAQMHGVNSTAYLRLPFQVPQPNQLDRLMLRIKYDDGFRAWLNGTPIASRNARDAMQWNSTATAQHPNVQGSRFEEIDVSHGLSALVTGQNVLAIQGLNFQTDNPDFLVSAELEGLDLIEQQRRYFSEPTPGARNAAGFVDFVVDTQFSHDRGFYDAPFDLVITTDTPGATVVYTSDGSEPTLTHGVQVPPASNVAPGRAVVPIAATTTLRAAAFKSEFQSTNVDTQTYVFVFSVLQQPLRSLPRVWGPRTADYEMDPEVVGPENLFQDEYRSTVLSDLKSLPVLSLVMNDADIFGPSGVYSNPSGRGNEWERPVSVEFFNPGAGRQFQLDAGIRLSGNIVRLSDNPKRSMRLYFRDEYGSPKLDFPLFDGSPVEQFDKLDIRAIYNDSWMQEPHPVVTANTGQFVRDRFMQDLYRDMGHLAPRSRFTHLYINGLYWGMYQITERPDEDFAEEHLGGDKTDYDVIKHIKGGGSELVAGTRDAWNQMMGLARSGLKDEARYDAISQLLDLEAFADYMLVNCYTGNYDWPHNNWYAIRSRVEAGATFQFVIWDAELIFLSDVNLNKLTDNPADTPGALFTALRQNARFRQLFADRAHKWMFNDGMLQPGPVAARYQALLDQVESPIVAESARWGDVRRAAPYTKQDWLAESNRILVSYIPQRHAIFLSQLRTLRLYPQIAAPVFNQHGGRIAAGYGLDMRVPDGDPATAIYYTMDGSDPRSPAGSITGTLYTGQPLVLFENSQIQARSYVGGQWSALNTAQFVVATAPLVITEVNYNPYDPTHAELSADARLDNDDFEFIEVQNVGHTTAELLNYRFTDGVTFAFRSFELAAGEYAVIVKNLTAFRLRYGDEVRVIGEFDRGSLANDGETLTLTDPLGDVVFGFRYGDAVPWPESPDGGGGTLVLTAPTTTPADERGKSYRWRGSSEYGGSPGRAGQESLGIIISEVLANPGPSHPRGDVIELSNPTAVPINIGGWYLSDAEADLLKYRITAGTILLPGQYIVFDESHFNTVSAGDRAFGLSAVDGDDVWLTVADDSGQVMTIVDDVHFGPSQTGESFGRLPQSPRRLAPLARPSLGAPNTAARVGPLVISEVHYHPAAPRPEALVIDPQLDADDLEFVEVLNPTSQTVDLSQWRLEGGIEFEFPRELLLGGGETVTVVSFDPDRTENAPRTQAFRAQYGLSSDVRLVGGYAGQLSDSEDRVQLQRLVRTADQMPVYLWEDEVIYDDRAAWPPTADGQGPSLQRLRADWWGSDPHNWIADDATPGRSTGISADLNGDGAVDLDDIQRLYQAINTSDLALDLDGSGQTDGFDLTFYIHHVLQTSFGDANLDGVFDSSDMVQVFQAAEYEDAVSGNSTWAEGDWNGDGEFSSADFVIAFQEGTYEMASMGRSRQAAPAGCEVAIAAAMQDQPTNRRFAASRSKAVPRSALVDVALQDESAFWLSECARFGLC